MDHNSLEVSTAWLGQFDVKNITREGIKFYANDGMVPLQSALFLNISDGSTFCTRNIVGWVSLKNDLIVSHKQVRKHHIYTSDIRDHLHLLDTGKQEYWDAIISEILDLTRKATPWIPLLLLESKSCNPDPNLDGRVDILDLVIVAKCFGQDTSTSPECKQADTNWDGKVDIFDLVCVAQNFEGGCPTIPNGDFESGDVSWTEYSQNGWDLIDQWGVQPAYSGTWYTWLGGGNNEISYIEQEVAVYSPCPNLVFYHWISSSDTCGNDYGYVKINGINATPAIQLCTAENTGGWVKKSINLSSYANQAITLKFEAVTNSSNSSSWYIDDVSFEP